MRTVGRQAADSPLRGETWGGDRVAAMPSRTAHVSKTNYLRPELVARQRCPAIFQAAGQEGNWPGRTKTRKPDRKVTGKRPLASRSH